MPNSFAAGPNATRWLQRFGDDVPICAFDFGSGATAIYDIVARRRRAQRHDAIVFLPDSRNALLAQVAPAFFAQNQDYDALCELFDAFAAGALTIAGRPQNDYLQQDASEVLVCRDALKVADRVLFRSHAEYRRTCAILGWYPKRYCIASPLPACEIAGSGAAQPSIVIWADSADPVLTRFVDFAIRGEFGVPVAVVSADQIEGVTVIAPADAAPLLRSARAIVDVSLYDPSAAVLLAGYERPLMSPNTNGSEELVDGVVLFDCASRRAIVAATAAVLASPPAAVSARAAARLGLEEHQGESAVTGPLVSVIVPTHNRREDLEVTLRSVAAQTYENIELIVVNDAGASVSDIVARFEGARVIDLEKNSGLAAARNAGIRVASGRYVAFLDDDDAFFPEHVADLVAALERTGETFARSNAVTRYVESEGGRSRTFCFKMEMDLYASLSDLYANNHFNSMVVMIRRDAFERHGLFDETLPSTEDYEMWLRLASRYPILHVDRVNGEYTRLTDRSAMTYRLRSRRIDSFTQIYNAYPSGRPAVEQRRKGTLDWWVARDGVAPAEPSFRMEDPGVTAWVDGNLTVD